MSNFLTGPPTETYIPTYGIAISRREGDKAPRTLTEMKKMTTREELSKKVDVLKDDITGWSARPIKKATHKEIVKMFNFLEDDATGWVSRTFSMEPVRYRYNLEKDIMQKALGCAELLGECCNSTLVLKDEPHEHTEVGCMTWKISSNGYYYKVHYITNDLDVYADSLDEDMMDDLVIEGPFRIV